MPRHKADGDGDEKDDEEDRDDCFHCFLQHVRRAL
jgi:hypothetical protein